MLQCAVRRLRVAAASEPAARRFVTTLEDALRCATLPGDDRRLVVVRRLALGRVAHDAGTQRLGLLIEQRLARGEIAWADGEAAPDPRANAVGFATPLEARVHLARRLVQGAPCDAWYWPLAVPEFRDAPSPRAALRHMAQVIAALPEARVALPDWIARAVDAGGAAALCAAIDEPAVHALLRAAGIAQPSGGHVIDAAPRPARDGAVAPASWPARGTMTPSPALPAWLGEVLMRTRGNALVEAPRSAAATSAECRSHEASAAAAMSMSTTDSYVPMQGATASSIESNGPAEVDNARMPAAQAPPPVAAESKLARGHVSLSTPSSLNIDGDWHPTACGGLLFLLPVLAKANLVQGESPDDDRAAAQRVLRAALRRVRADADDAAWALVADLPVLPPNVSADDDDRARAELAAARRWLQRHARLGLVTLVRRPARIALTATHIDVRFPLAGAEVRVRRLGLDIDPGWLPWFGRVIAFRFVGRLP